MRLNPFWAFSCLLCMLPITASAVQFIDLNLISPITGRTFSASGLPLNQNETVSLADMGSDDDGCRHTSGQCEYDYYVAVDPTSYFAAMTMEWDARTGAFRPTLTDECKEWAQRTFNGQLQYDIESNFKRARDAATTRGEPLIDRKDFQLKQSDIPVEMRYWLALECYKKRNASPGAMALLALNGAWALRAYMNVPAPAVSFLADGFSEVNDLIARNIKDGESFDFQKWLRVYKDIFSDKNLSNEGYLVAGFSYFGFALRDGDKEVCDGILQSMTERFKDEEKDRLRGLVRERQRLYQDQARKQSTRGVFSDTRGVSSYITFLTRAAENFVIATGSEEYTRANLPVKMLATAECMRRIGAKSRAMDWYLALASLPETQPGIRETLRAQGKFPSTDAPWVMQLGWIADGAIKRLIDGGLVHSGKPLGPDRTLLNAIINEGLGTAAYVNPSWKPVTGQSMQDLAQVIDQTTKALVDYTYRRKVWPKELGELWEHGVVRDRNRLNRFYCPVTGKPLLYNVPTSDLDHIDKRTVLVAASEAVSTTQGPRYCGMLANLTLVWSDQPLQSGSIYSR